MTPRPEHAENSVVHIFAPDGSLNVPDVQRILGIIGARAQEAITAMQTVLRVSKESYSNFGVARMAFTVGVEIGQLLAEIPNLQRLLSMAINDARATSASAQLGMFIDPLEMAMRSLSLQEADVAPGAAGELGVAAEGDTAPSRSTSPREMRAGTGRSSR